MNIFVYFDCRSPFSGQSEFTEKRANLLKLAIDMATNGQRDRFADKPVAEISRMANQLAKLADEIIQVFIFLM